MVDLGHLGVVGEIVDDAQGILHMALHTEAEGLEALQEDPRVERTDGRSGIAQEHGTRTGDKSCRSGHVGEDGSMITGVGLGQCGELVGIGLPVELSAVDDDTPQRTAMSADELGGGVQHDIGTMLNGTNEERRSERVVDEERDIVTVSNLGQAVDISNVGVGVSEGLGIKSPGLGQDGSLYGLQVAHVDDGVLHSKVGQSMGDEVERAAIEIVGSHDMVARQQDILQGQSDGSGTRRHGQSGHATLKGSHPLLEHTLCGVGESAIDVAGIAQAETVGSMLRVAEHIGCGLVDRHRAGIGCWVGLLLTYMELEGLETILVLAHNFFLSLFILLMN